MSEEVEVKETRKALTPAQWAEIVTLWELGEVTLEDLSSRFGISISGLSKGLKERGATKGSRSREIADKVKTAVLKSHEAEAVSASEERQRKIHETRTQHYTWAEFLAKAIVGRVQKAYKEERAPETEHDNIKTLRQAALALETLRQTRYTVLNADEALQEQKLPELIIRDLSDDEIERLRSKVDEDDEDVVGPIELPDGLEEIVEDV